MSDHLGYDRHEVAGRGSGNSCNGTRPKTVLTENVGPVQVEVPRDRDGSFDPLIVRKSRNNRDVNAHSTVCNRMQETPFNTLSKRVRD